jgi:hypothetical protein
MILKCWIVATIVGIMTFSAGILSVALYFYLTSRPERDSLGLRGWLWLDGVKSHLKDKNRPQDKGPNGKG